MAEGATIQPQNNKQAYLAYALGLITDASHLPEPKTSEEALLKEYCLNGGGGGSATPFITDISYMFYNGTRNDCIPEILSLCGPITRAVSAFNGSDKLKEVDITGLDVRNADNFSSFFSSCMSLESVVGLDTLDLSSARLLNNFFYYCSKLNNLDGVASWNVSNVDKFDYMFSYCNALTDASFLRDWDVRNGTTFASMFANCKSLKNVDMSKWNMSSATSLISMFQNCTSLGIENSQDFSNWSVGKVTTFKQLFSGCSNIKQLNIGGWDVSSARDMSYMFDQDVNLTSIGDISSWNVGDVKSFEGMFSNCNSITSAGLGGNGAFSSWNTASLTNTAYMFQGCNSLKTVLMYNWNTSHLKNASFMFQNAGIDSFEMTGWDTTNLTNISSMFAGCMNLAMIFKFSAVGVTTANTYAFPTGTSTSNRAALNKLTFKTFAPGKYAFRSNIDLKYCSFYTNGAQEMFNSLPDIKPLRYTRNITLTGNPCVTGVGVDGASCDTLTDSMKAVAVSKGWNIVA